jgi:hypothetical protein
MTEEQLVNNDRIPSCDGSGERHCGNRPRADRTRARTATSKSRRSPPRSANLKGGPPHGPWLLSIDHPGVAAELAALPPSPLPEPGLATFGFDTLTALHAALDRVYKLGV